MCSLISRFDPKGCQRPVSENSDPPISLSDLQLIRLSPPNLISRNFPILRRQTFQLTGSHSVYPPSSPQAESEEESNRRASEASRPVKDTCLPRYMALGTGFGSLESLSILARINQISQQSTHHYHTTAYPCSPHPKLPPSCPRSSASMIILV